MDRCNYQLVDEYDHRVIQSFWNQTCNSGFDACSVERDRLNSQMNEYRYFCSETFRDERYDQSSPTYDDVYYDPDRGSPSDNTCEDQNRDRICDNYNQGNTCVDNDRDGRCDPGTI